MVVNYELVFSGVGLLAMFGWLLLLLSPWFPIWSDRVAGLAIPMALAAGYLVILVLFPSERGGFGNFAEVSELFSNPHVLMAGWIHFIAFDLVVGAWICRKARAEGISFWIVAPCLAVTFLFGPAGFLLFLLVRAGNAVFSQRHGSENA